MTLLRFILAVQVLTFFSLSAMFFIRGDWRLGVSQLLLGLVNAVIYSGRMN